MPRQQFHNRPATLERRRDLRRRLTPAEAALWRLLRRSQLEGRKFRRQHGIGNYIVDFYCPKERLIVELDGAAHDSEQAVALDQAREEFLKKAGMTILRVENRHVFENPEGVLALIAEQFNKG